MAIKTDKLRKLAEALKNIPEGYVYVVQRTILKHGGDLYGGCAWGYTPFVFPDEVIRDHNKYPRLKQGSTGTTFGDCQLFFNIDEEQRNFLFQHQTMHEMVKLETAVKTAQKILRFCKKHEE